MRVQDLILRSPPQAGVSKDEEPRISRGVSKDEAAALENGLTARRY